MQASCSLWLHISGRYDNLRDSYVWIQGVCSGIILLDIFTIIYEIQGVILRRFTQIIFENTPVISCRPLKQLGRSSSLFCS